MNKDLRNSLAKARDEWLASQEGRGCTDGTTIHLHLSQNEYLRNRIESAFIAGWHAKENNELKRQEEETKGSQSKECWDEGTWERTV